MRLTRRQLLGTAGLFSVTALPTAVAQSWKTSDGLRLAGPVSGLSTLDPALTRDLQAMFIVRQIFRGLLRFDSDLAPVSDLAELIDQDDQLLWYTFRLREDAAFADDRPITSDAVTSSLSRALDPKTGGSVGALAAITYLGDIEGAADVLSGVSASLSGVESIDERTLRISLIEPSSTFLIRLASVPTSIVDVSETVANPATWWRSPNATGPFLIKELTDELLELHRNPAYPVPESSIQRVTFVLGPGASNPLNLFQADSIDLVGNATGQASIQFDDPASSIPANVVGTPLFATSYIALGNLVPPLDDVHIRRALRSLISQDLIADAMFAGTVKAATGLIPDGMLGKTWTATSLGAQFDKARSELAASRYGTAADVPAIPIYSADIEAVETLRDLASTELGLRIDAIEVRWSDFLAGLTERRFPAYALYWGADYPDPEAMLGMLFRSDGSDNYTGYVNPGFDAILSAARAVAESDSRAALYQKAQDLLIEDAAVIPLYFDIGVTLSRPGISGINVTPLGILGLESVTQAS